MHSRPCALVAGFLLAVSVVSMAHEPAPSVTTAGIDPGLGTVHHRVTTKDPRAQAYFDQGMRLVFAFNHEAAIRSFERALEFDPDLALAYWGIGYALGPNINNPMDAKAHAAAYAAMTKARALAHRASPAERAYIEALAHRYSADAQADQAPLALAYKDAMRELARRYPNDDDAAVLYAESLMDLAPWNYWAQDGTPQPGTLEIVAVLERVLARAPHHTGANHYYIHAVEASPHPEKALASARRLETLAPAAGHLVHMPAHTYIRTGQYLDAARVNVAAAKADERLAATRGDSAPMYLIGYYGHNLHFLAISNAFAGASQDALAAAAKLSAVQTPRITEAPWVDGFLMTQPLLLAEFGRWNEILALPEPPFEAPLTGAMWHFARTLALAATGRAAEARAEQALFDDAAAKMTATTTLGNNDARKLAQVAQPYLGGRLALLAGKLPKAVTLLRAAVAAEDALAYDEPPLWYLPARDALGTALLRAGDLPAAEQVFRDELVQHPESGRALFGLQAALAGQGREHEARAVRKRFDHAWRGADIALE